MWSKQVASKNNDALMRRSGGIGYYIPMPRSLEITSRGLGRDATCCRRRGSSLAAALSIVVVQSSLCRVAASFPALPRCGPCTLPGYKRARRGTFLANPTFFPSSLFHHSRKSSRSFVVAVISCVALTFWGTVKSSIITFVPVI